MADTPQATTDQATTDAQPPFPPDAWVNTKTPNSDGYSPMTGDIHPGAYVWDPKTGMGIITHVDWNAHKSEYIPLNSPEAKQYQSLRDYYLQQRGRMVPRTVSVAPTSVLGASAIQPEIPSPTESQIQQPAPRQIVPLPGLTPPLSSPAPSYVLDDPSTHINFPPPSLNPLPDSSAPSYTQSISQDNRSDLQRWLGEVAFRFLDTTGLSDQFAPIDNPPDPSLNRLQQFGVNTIASGANAINGLFRAPLEFEQHLINGQLSYNAAQAAQARGDTAAEQFYRAHAGQENRALLSGLNPFPTVTNAIADLFTKGPIAAGQNIGQSAYTDPVGTAMQAFTLGEGIHGLAGRHTVPGSAPALDSTPPFRVPTPEVSQFRAGAKAIDQAQWNWRQGIPPQAPPALSQPGFPPPDPSVPFQAALSRERPFSLGTSAYPGGSTGFRYQGMLPDGRIRIAHPNGLYLDLSPGRAAELAPSYSEAPSAMPGQSAGQEYVPYTEQAGASASSQTNSAPTKVRPPADPNSYGATIRRRLEAQAKPGELQYKRDLVEALQAEQAARERFAVVQDSLNRRQFNKRFVNKRLSAEDVNSMLSPFEQEWKAATAHVELVRSAWLSPLHAILAAPDPIGDFTLQSKLADPADPRHDTMRQATSFAGSIVSRSLLPFPGITLDEPEDSFYAPDNRAYHSSASNSIHLFPYDEVSTGVHEIGHHIESNSPKISAASRNFYNRRTAGESLVPLNGPRYKPNEVTREDAFISPYMGKEYGVPGHSEIISMGLEHLYKDPLLLAREDPDFFDLVIGALHGK